MFIHQGKRSGPKAHVNIISPLAIDLMSYDVLRNINHNILILREENMHSEFFYLVSAHTQEIGKGDKMYNGFIPHFWLQ